jgi:acetyl esterase
MSTEEPDEAVLDPWVAEWLDANSAMMEPPVAYSTEYLEMARPSACPFPTRLTAKITDEHIDGIPVRIYEHERQPAGLLVYMHGGGFCTGSIGLMENIATELAHCADVAVISVGYRLAPEHPYPAGVDDCESVVRWAVDNSARLGVATNRVVVAGESAGGNLATAVALRLRDDPSVSLAGQVLIYPALDLASSSYPSRQDCDGPMLRAAMLPVVWRMYAGTRVIDDDPHAVPMKAETMEGLPPALVILGGCDPLRDEGRAYARRLAADGVPTEEFGAAGQPHGYLNLSFPASAATYQRIGTWLDKLLA